MAPPFDEIRDSGAAGAASDLGAAESGDPEAPREPEPTVPAGEPEAPVAPAAPAKDADAPPAPADDPDGPGSDPAADAAPAAPAQDSDGAPPDADARDEQRLERDLDELTAKAEKADEYLELAQRTRADFENYRRRAVREAAAAQERGVVKLVRELLPAVDNLDRAVDVISSNGTGEDELVSGIKLVHAEVVAALNRAGIERFSPEGERFDPEHHEAVAQHPVEGAQAGTIVEVYQRGYRLGDAVIRPARVLVAG